MSALGQKRTLDNFENLCYQKPVMEQRKDCEILLGSIVNCAYAYSM